MKQLFLFHAFLICVNVLSAEYKNFREAIKDGNDQITKKDYAAARTAAESAGNLAHKPAELVEVKMILARISSNENDFKGARKICQEALAISGIADNQKFNVSTQIAETYIQEGDMKAYRKEVESLLPVQGNDSAKLGMLLNIVKAAKKQHEEECLLFAYEKILDMKDVKEKDLKDAYSEMAESFARRNNSDRLEKLMSRMLADQAVGSQKRFEAQAVITALSAVKSKSQMSEDYLQKNAPKATVEGLEAKDKYAALNDAAKIITIIGNYETARELMAMADKLLVKKEEKIYKCKYMAQVPLGAGGWFLSDFIKNPANRESRFEDYDQKSADMLFTDVAAARSVSGNAKKEIYFGNTAFYMAYDMAGWHMFVVCGDPDLDGILADGRGAGALEMYFSRGASGETYSQWIIDLPGGKLQSYDWNSPHRFFRQMGDYFKSDTVTLGDKMGTYIFVPWEALYDRLPLEGGKWPFGFIRWTPAGGITWGGKVHEIGQWGTVEWDKPSPEQALTIRKNIARKAWGKYKKNRDALTTHWKDNMLGDPKFFAEVMEPEIERLNKFGEKLNEPEKMTAEDVKVLPEDAVPDWMELDYLVSELRSRYLKNRLISKP
jgi:hypothetical protein